MLSDESRTPFFIKSPPLIIADLISRFSALRARNLEKGKGMRKYVAAQNSFARISLKAAAVFPSFLHL